MKIYRKISVLAMAALVLASGLTSCGEDDLDTNQYNKSGVNILAFGPMPITRGATMRVTGTKLNNVKEVLFPKGNQKLTPATEYINGEFSLQGSEEMTVTIPDQCVPGKLRLVTQSGDTVESASFITFAEEIKVSSISPNPVHPGDIVTIKGEYVWNIGQVVFFDHVVVNAEDFMLNTRNEIQVQVPMEAKTGDVAYNDGSDGAENTVITNLEVDAPKATGVSNANPEFGDMITITGENLDLVATLDFPSVSGVEFTAAADGKTINVKVPSNTVSGSIVMTSAAGIITSVDINVPLASVSSTSPVKDVKAGQTITITGDKLDRIVEILLPAIDEPLVKGDFAQSATQISFVVPEGMGDGKIILIQHENYSVETDKISMYSDAPENAIWSGTFVCSGWAGMQELAWGGFDWTAIAAGTKLRLYYSKNTPGAWGCISLRHGDNWGNLPSPIPGQYDLDEDAGVLEVTLTQDVLNDIIANNGLVVTGDNYTLTKIAIPIPETKIWSGEFVCSGWGGNQELAWGGFDWTTIPAGSKFFFTYKKITAGSWGCISLRHGDNWGNLPDPIPGQYDLDEDEGVLEVTFTQAVLDDIIANNGLVITGDNYILYKIVMR